MAQQATVIAPEDRPAGIKFEKIWNRAKDKDVAVVVLHVSGTTLCMDDRHALTADEVIDCCKHGCIVEVDGVYFRPVSWGVEGDVAGVKCITASSDNTPILRTLKSYADSPME